MIPKINDYQPTFWANEDLSWNFGTLTSKVQRDLNIIWVNVLDLRMYDIGVRYKHHDKNIIHNQVWYRIFQHWIRNVLQVRVIHVQNQINASRDMTNTHYLDQYFSHFESADLIDVTFHLSFESDEVDEPYENTKVYDAFTFYLRVKYKEYVDHNNVGQEIYFFNFRIFYKHINYLLHKHGHTIGCLIIFLMQDR